MNEEMMKAFMAIDTIYPMIKYFEPVTFQCMLGCLVDAYAKDHGMTPGETFAILEELAEVQKQVHAVLGA